MHKKWIGIGLGTVVVASVVFTFFTKHWEAKITQCIETNKESDGGSQRITGAFLRNEDVRSIHSRVNIELSAESDENVNEQEMCSQIDELISSQDFEAALSAVEQWLSRDIPPYLRERLFLYKGNLLYATNDLQRAYEVYRKALIEGKRDDVREWVTVKLYAVAGKLNLIDVMFQEFETVYTLQPDNIRFGYILADLYAYQQDTASETAIRATLLINDPGNLENGMKLIAAYEREKNPAAAAEVAGNLAVSDPDNSAAHLLRQATLLVQANDNDTALAVCDAVFTSEVANAQVLLRCGYLYEQLGSNKRAMATFTRASEIATQQYRKERCIAESLRLKQVEYELLHEDVEILETLVERAQAAAVRELAKEILDLNK